MQVNRRAEYAKRRGPHASSQPSVPCTISGTVKRAVDPCLPAHYCPCGHAQGGIVSATWSVAIAGTRPAPPPAPPAASASGGGKAAGCASARGQAASRCMRAGAKPGVCPARHAGQPLGFGEGAQRAGALAVQANSDQGSGHGTGFEASGAPRASAGSGRPDRPRGVQQGPARNGESAGRDGPAGKAVITGRRAPRTAV